MSEVRQFSSFLADELLFGVDVQDVQEVIRHLEMTRIPMAPPEVGGLINLRGRIIAAIDLRRCLNLAERPSDQASVHLILRTADGLVSLLVDEIWDVLELRADDRAFCRETLRGRLREFVQETYKLPRRLLLVLDTERLLSAVWEGGGVLRSAAPGGPG